MAEAAFDPAKYLAEKTAPSPFDPSKYLAEKTGAAPESPGLLSKIGLGIDSVTGAPMRAGVYAAQEGKNPFSAAWDQLGTSTGSPSGKDIVKRAGVPDKDTVIQTAEDRKKFNEQFNPGWAASLKQIGKEEGPVTTNPADTLGLGMDLAANPLNFVPLGGAGRAFSAGTKAAAPEISAAATRLGFKATAGMLADSPVVQGLESSLSQSPSLSGASVRGSIKPIASGLQNAAEDLVSGNGAKTAYAAGSSGQGGVLASLGEKVNNIQGAYEPFNQELPKMIPNHEARWKLADQIAKVGENHLDPNEIGGIIKGVSNRIMNSESLGDIEETRKLLGSKISKAYSDNDHALVDTLTKMKDKLSDFRDDQFQKLSQEAYPGPGGYHVGQQMQSQYKNAMDQHAALMSDLRDVGPVFGIKAKNPRDFVEAFSEMPPEQIAKKLFNSNDINSIKKVEAYFPQEFENIRSAKLQDLRSKSLENPIDPNNSAVDPTKLVRNINKMPKEVQEILFGEKSQTLQDMQTVLGSLPKDIGPSGTPRGEMFNQSWNPAQQGTEFLRHMGYKALSPSAGPGSGVVPGAAIGSLSNIIKPKDKLKGR